MVWAELLSYEGSVARQHLLRRATDIPRDTDPLYLEDEKATGCSKQDSVCGIGQPE
jgi:hypothetical protein